MNKIILQSELLRQLDGVSEQAEVCDSAGRVVGVFVPVSARQYEIADPPTEEELDRIEENLTGRPLAAILNELEASA